MLSATSHTPAESLASRSPRQSAILEAALQCFTTLGYANATIEDVRRASGASVGSIYHHFGDKEGIAGALYVEGLRRYQTSLLLELLGADGRSGARTARNFIRGIVIQTIDWMTAHPDWARFLFEMRRAEGVQAAESSIRSETRLFFDRLSVELKRYVERGEIRRLPMEVLAALLVGPAQELARHWQRVGPPEDLAGIRNELADAAWRGVRAERKKKRSG